MQLRKNTFYWLARGVQLYTHGQTTNLTFGGEKIRYTIESYTTTYLQIGSDSKYHKFNGVVLLHKVYNLVCILEFFFNIWHK